jgi:multicomponent Na+:H+ antiporter subunit G
MRLVVVAALLTIGVGFSLTAGLGLIRMPDVYTRVPSSTLAAVLGAVPVFLALVVGKGPISRYGGESLLACILVLVFAPLSAHALLRATYRGRVPLWSGAKVDQPRDRLRGKDSGADAGDEPDSGAGPEPQARG